MGHIFFYGLISIVSKVSLFYRNISNSFFLDFRYIVLDSFCVVIVYR